MNKRYDRGLVGWLSLAQLITWGSVFYLFALVMEPIERELGLSRAQSSLAFSLALLAEGVLAYQVGRWIDHGHERLVMTTGSLWLGICLALQSTVTSMAGFYAAWIGLGAGMAATLYTPVFAVVTRRFPGDFRRAIITMTFLGGLASTVFVPLIYGLIAQFGWRHALCVWRRSSFWYVRRCIFIACVMPPNHRLRRLRRPRFPATRPGQELATSTQPHWPAI